MLDAADEVEPSLEELLTDDSLPLALPALPPPLAPSFPEADFDELSLPEDAADVAVVPRESLR